MDDRDALTDALHRLSADLEMVAAPMADAVDVRRRGRQIHRRRTIASATTAVLLVVGVGGAAVSTLAGNDLARTDPGVATQPPSTSSTPSPAPEPSASPSAATPARGLLLGLDAVDRAEPGSWTPSSAPRSLPLIDPCSGGTAYPRDTDRTDTASTTWQTLREGGGTSVDQTVARYRSVEAAADAARGYERAVVGCPSDNGALVPSPSTYSVVRSGTENGAFTVVVRQSQGCDVCYAGYYAVQQQGDLVSVLSVAHGEDGDPGAAVIEPFLPEALRALTRG